MHWTHSRLTDYETCPKRHEFKSVLRVPEPGPKGPALLRGDDVHKSCEDFLRFNSDTLHPDISPAWAAQVRQLRDAGAMAEQMWEFDADWHPYTHNEPLWLRMKLDANYRVPRRRDRLPTHRVIDFKTGKFYHHNKEQVEIYALGTFAMFDDIEQVQAELWYFDSDEPYEKTYTRSQTSKLARKWEGRAARLLEAKEFPANPGPHCGWCPFRAACPQAYRK